MTTIVIDLSGPAGNSYALAATAKQWEQQLGVRSGSLITGTGSYETLLDRFDARFKGVIDYRFEHDPRVGAKPSVGRPRGAKGRGRV